MVVAMLDQVILADSLADSAEKRRFRRRPVLWKGHVDVASHRLSCRLRDIAPGGMLAELDLPLAAGAELKITLPQAHRPLPATVAWSRGTLHGLSFNEPQALVAAAFGNRAEMLGLERAERRAQ